jgi:hypothetical protein
MLTFYLNARLHWQSFLVKALATATDFGLALATLGNMTQIGSFLFVLHHPR